MSQEMYWPECRQDRNKNLFTGTLRHKLSLILTGEKIKNQFHC